LADKFKKIAIFCGSNMGADAAYREDTKKLAETLVNANIGLIYGGARVGLMGVLADSVNNLGGEVIGVIPQSLVDYEVAHTGLTELRVVNSMHERKAMIVDLADGFIMLPGGIGTLEEFFEVTTWAKLSYHQKPCGILNTNNFYNQLINFLDHMMDQKFIQQEYRHMIQVETCPEKLLQKFMSYQAPTASAWIEDTKV
jgi:uncharacterized protein (TIGR00730 family)